MNAKNGYVLFEVLILSPLQFAFAAKIKLDHHEKADYEISTLFRKESQQF